MRTTLTLERDVADKIKKTTRETHRSAKDVINAALRLGLQRMHDAPKARPFVTQAKPMGLRAGLSYDNVADLLASGEVEDFK